MQVTLNNLYLTRGEFTLTTNGVFEEGVHLVWGSVGAGKSTLALALASLLLPTSGEVIRQGITTLRLSLQFPEYHVTSRSLEDEILSWGINPAQVLKATGLTGRGSEDPLSLSRGELKRLELWCALEGDPDLLLLDEPFSSLDCVGRRAFLKALEERTRGITILFTHDHGPFPGIDFLWEIHARSLIRRGRLPEALPLWSTPPPYLRDLLDRGIVPPSITIDAIWEAGCRTDG